MAGKNTAAFGIFKSRAQAERCVDALMSEGYRSDDAVPESSPGKRNTPIRIGLIHQGIGTRCSELEISIRGIDLHIRARCAACRQD